MAVSYTVARLSQEHILDGLDVVLLVVSCFLFWSTFTHSSKLATKQIFDDQLWVSFHLASSSDPVGGGHVDTDGHPRGFLLHEA